MSEETKRMKKKMDYIHRGNNAITDLVDNRKRSGRVVSGPVKVDSLFRYELSGDYSIEVPCADLYEGANVTVYFSTKDDGLSVPKIRKNDVIAIDLDGMRFYNKELKSYDGCVYGRKSKVSAAFDPLSPSEMLERFGIY